ncbi:MAG: exosortase/archaeosortase family protein [Isosphaeraceae bacterium]
MSTTDSLSRPDSAVDATEDAARVTSKLWGAARLVVCLIVGAVALWAYFPEFQWLWETWTSDPNYSHGFLVIPVAALIFWKQKVDPVRRDHPWQWGWVLLGLVLIARVVLYERGNRWAGAMTLLAALACLTLTLGGFRLLRRAAPALAYLIFMIPLPSSINDVVSQPLQSLATSASVALLRLTGLWVISEGNVIYLGKHPLAVAEACNGLSMMMSLGATAVAAVLLVPIAIWMRAVVLITVLPIALLSNVIRIVATGWSIHLLGPEKGGTIAHDAAGWLMMPLALALVALELAILHWLFVEEETAMQPMLLGKPILGRARTELEGPGTQAGLPSNGPQG